METFVEQLVSQDVTLINAVAKLLLSLMLGALIGLERRRKGQIAGLRTFALISMGATLAMLISIYIPQEFFMVKNGDPGRVAAQVISGVGFLGAGAIIQMKGSVRGLTTAAGIWIAACIGLAVGCGMYLIAVIATLLIIFILVNIERIEQRVGFLWEAKIVRLRLHGIVTDLQPARDVMKAHGVHSSDEYVKYDYDSKQTIVNFMVRTRDAMDPSAMFADMSKHLDLASATLTNELNL